MEDTQDHGNSKRATTMDRLAGTRFRLDHLDPLQGGET